MKRYRISPGGCGNYYLQSLFRKYVNVKKETLNTHSNNPLSPDENSRVAYIYGDPFNIILSFYRRGFLSSPYTHFRHIGGDYKTMERLPEWSLKDFLSLKKDPLFLFDHFRAWYFHDNRNYDIAFFRYESLADTIQDLCLWYELDKSIIKDFSFSPRSSNWKDQDISIQRGLENNYGEYKAFLDKLPDVVINPSTQP